MKQLGTIRHAMVCCAFVLTSPAAEVDFNRDVLPILSDNCFQCHGPDGADRKANLRLDKAGDNTDVLAPGNPKDSLLVGRIGSTDPDEQMPPPESGKKLTDEQRETLHRWIKQGAVYQKHWAFKPIAEVSPPEAGEPGLTGIDRFVAAKLEENDLSLSEPITREQLIRRATFDLTGLPPTWSEVVAFLEDESPDAFAKVVDRLLASDAYGERWGRHWLDLARYADTHGASAIGFVRFPFSYTYRDYVIGAFNDDLPYDRFLLEQLAADQLGLEENDPALAALGFLTVGRQYRNVHDRIDDQIDVISRGLLGLTVSCARCHDHKFDPVPTADYYSLYAALSSSHVPNDLPIVGNPTITENYQIALKEREEKRDAIEGEQLELFQNRLRLQTGMYLKEIASGTPEQDTSTFFLSFRTEDLRPIILERWRKYLNEMDENDPVFGPWHRLSALKEDGFQAECEALARSLTEENGDPEKCKDEQRFATPTPRWNPRILDALSEAKPKTFVEVAGVYGDVFTAAYRAWLTQLLEASLEAAPGGKPLSDQAVEHRILNSAIERQLRFHLTGPDSPTSVDLGDRHALRMLNRGIRDGIGRHRGSIDALNLTREAPPRAMILEEEADESTETFVFLRGNPIQRGEKVEPAFLSIISEENRNPFPVGAKRLALARAIVDESNPLAPRVIVNWIWQHHFGRGLVRTSDDFGTRGDPPSHPELLDFLARKFVEDGWSIKEMHRHIMLSAVYQQSSLENPAAREKDPTNRLLWRMPRRRLDLESMRDALLAVSGELDRTAGGQPFEEKGDKTIPRRSVYAFLNRDVIPPMVATFDGADPSACTVKRQETMVPQQTLFALNSNYIQQRAVALMKLEEIAAAPDDEERLEQIYRRVYSRNPQDDEIAEALGFLRESKGEKSEAWSQLVHAMLASNEFHFLD